MLSNMKNLFPSAAARQKSAEDMKRDADRARRALSRRTGMMIGKLNHQVIGLEEKRRDSHNAARTALVAGDKASAQRHIIAARQKLCLIEKVEKQRFVFEHVAVMTEINISEREMTELMVDMAKVNNIDPVRVDNALQDVMAAIEKGRESDDIWDMVSKEQMHALGLSGSTVPSADKMLEELAAEVAQGIRAGTDPVALATPGNEPVNQRIGEGRARLTRLVESLK